MHLIFMGLNSLEECIQRVAHRVKAGGHKVSEESIKYNYTHGFKNLYKYFEHFDTVTLLDNSVSKIGEAIIPVEILHIIDETLYLQIEDYPDWAKPIIKSFDDPKIIIEHH